MELVTRLLSKRSAFSRLPARISQLGLPLGGRPNGSNTENGCWSAGMIGGVREQASKRKQLDSHVRASYLAPHISHSILNERENIALLLKCRSLLLLSESLLLRKSSRPGRIELGLASPSCSHRGWSSCEAINFVSLFATCPGVERFLPQLQGRI